MILENPQTSEAVLIAELQTDMEGLTPPTVKMLTAHLEFNNLRESYKGNPKSLIYSSLSTSVKVATNEAVAAIEDVE
jgi:hypothetical protein